MAIDRWNPFQDMISWRDAMDRFFGDSFGGMARGGTPMDVMETDNGYTVHASLPGFRPDEIQVRISGDTLTLRAEHREDTSSPDTGTGTTPSAAGSQSAAQGTSNQGTTQGGSTTQSRGQYIMRERRMQTVFRTITLPSPINADAAQAQFENGVLILMLPRAASTQPRQIPITSGQGQAQGQGQNPTLNQPGGGSGTTAANTGAPTSGTPSPDSGNTGTTGGGTTSPDAGVTGGGTTSPGASGTSASDTTGADDSVDEASEESFPASDPPSTSMATSPETSSGSDNG